MKSVFIFNQLNDIVFMHYDEGFRRHVNKQASGAGFAEEIHSAGPLDPNVAMQLFSPLVASLRFMTDQLSNPYQSIRCENDFLFVMEQYHEHILLGINGDQSETEEFIHRKLLILQRILRFFFGPCDEEIRRDRVQDRDARWRFVAQLLDTWVDLYTSEQSFLVEAVERLHVNQLLNAKCIQLLEMVLSSMRTTGNEKGAVHALLTVNCKLLSLFSMRTAYELLPSDLLLLILLAKTKFPTQQRLEDFFSHSVNVAGAESFPMPDDKEQYQGPVDDVDLNEEVDIEYFSSVSSTPDLSPDRGPSPAHEDDPGNVTSSGNLEGTGALLSRFEEALQAVAEDPSLLLEMYYPPSSQAEEERKSDRHTVMLGTPNCKYSPHSVYCVQVMPGVALIILCEVSRSKLSGTICQTVSVLRAILHKSSVSSLQGKQTIDFIDSNLKKITDMMKKMKGGSRTDNLVADITKKWELSRRSGLLAYLDSRDDGMISSRLEATLSGMLDRLKVLFKVLYLTSRRPSAEHQLNLSLSVEYCQGLMRRHLYDYKEYLAVKAQRNFTMTNFVEDFPGLIHFIYVDRSMHQMMAPSINVTSQPDKGKVDMMSLIKAKLWSKLPDIQSRLRRGNITQILRDGDFLYSYFLWFEDGSGHPVHIPNTYDGIRENILPGVLAGGFYRQTTRQLFPGVPQQGQLKGYELYMLHVGILPTHTVLRQGRKLAAMMWETTGEANSPITLL